MADSSRGSSQSLSELPSDELAVYGTELGLRVDSSTPRGELLRLVRERQELLLDVDRDALLDIVVWARMPVRQSAGKELLARQVSKITKADFSGLSDRGLRTLARLRGIAFEKDEPRTSIEEKIKSQEGFLARFERKRRAVIGSLVSRWFERNSDDGAYQFLPEQENTPTLKDNIENSGVVGGIAQKLRGAADKYVEQKLDEIEQRIDRKLDEIDRRLAEWRDREIANRLRIVKITIIAAIIVAMISLGYDYMASKGHADSGRHAGTASTELVSPSIEGDRVPGQ